MADKSIFKKVCLYIFFMPQTRVFFSTLFFLIAVSYCEAFFLLLFSIASFFAFLSFQFLFASHPLFLESVLHICHKEDVLPNIYFHFGYDSSGTSLQFQWEHALLERRWRFYSHFVHQVQRIS